MLQHNRRRGAVLLIVLVVVMFLAVAGYAYSRRMISELELVAQAEADVQSRLAADSGVEWVAAQLATRKAGDSLTLLNNSDRFRAQLVKGDPARSRSAFRFTVVAPVEHDLFARGVRYGLMDESARLNLNTLRDIELEDDELSEWLIPIPGMTDPLIAAIRDWIDEDDVPLPGGAESDYYGTLTPPYRAKNGPLGSLDELLQVKGVTPALLYGEDTNRNGVLDPNENDADASWPLDNADGILNFGWTAYLSAHAFERNLRADGSDKINLNTGFLTDLYDQLEDEFGQDVATFVTAFRMSGPTKDLLAAAESAAGGVPPRSSGQPGGGGGGGRSGGGNNPNPSNGGNSGGLGAGASLGGTGISPGGTVTRNGMDLSKGAAFQINSIYDLIDSQTTVVRDGGTPSILNSPWKNEPSEIERLLPTLVDTLGLSDEPSVLGRINIQQARMELLVGLPGMTQGIADIIMTAQPIDSTGSYRGGNEAKYQTTGWLLIDGHVDLPTMRSLDKFITAGGDVFRVQILGLADAGGPVARVEAIIDATRQPPRIVAFQDLRDLGIGFPRSWLTPAATPSP
jgi:uncharacterized membrane protein YgcG